MRREIINALILFCVVLFGGLALMYITNNNSAASSQTASPTPASQPAQQSDATLLKKIQITDETIGTGKEAKNGTTVTVNYAGTLQNGQEFDSSYKRNQPFSFTLGKSEVIKGWDLGVAGMRVGGKRKLIIPPELAYGNQQTGSIPPHSTLIFEVELLSVK